MTNNNSGGTIINNNYYYTIYDNKDNSVDSTKGTTSNIKPIISKDKSKDTNREKESIITTPKTGDNAPVIARNVIIITILLNLVQICLSASYLRYYPSSYSKCSCNVFLTQK